MTEDEAKTKWCPHTRAGFADQGGVNNRPDGSLNCIASACMAWRWKRELISEEPIRLIKKYREEHPDTTLREARDEVVERGWGRQERPLDRGYCGLAGPSQ